METQLLVRQISQYFPASRSSMVITLALLCLIAYQLAGLTWLLFPQADSSFSWQPNIQSRGQSQAGHDLSALDKGPLFGQYQPKKAEAAKPAEPAQNQDAPKTKLKLTLTGLVYSSDQQRALAVISHRNKESAYAVGEPIDGTQASLHEIQLDRVILKHRGNFESLFLDPEEKQGQRKASNNNTQRSNKPKPSGRNSTTSSASANVKDILKDPSKLTDFIRISPVRADGELKGYRVNPGKSRELFQQVGLKANDLAVALNGYDLRDNAQAMQVMQELAELSEVTVTVEREGQLQDIFFSLPEE